MNTTGNASDTFIDGICDTSGAVGQQCTLRGAIQEANGIAGLDTITFSLATPFRVTLTASGLPAITSPVTIDGTSLPSFNPGAGTIVRVDGVSNTTGVAFGFSVASGGAGTTIKGLEIVRMSTAGIRLASDSNTVTGNYVGTTAGGLVNCVSGVSCSTGIAVDIEDGSDNVVGGTTAADRNVLSNNANYGVRVLTTAGSADDNVVQGNYIGVTPAGTAALPNYTGVLVTASAGEPVGTVIGGTVAGAGNVISGNSSNGVQLDNGPSTVAGNTIGLRPAGDLAIPNTGDSGVATGPAVHDTTIGGATTAARNVISGNSQEGITLYGNGSTSNVVVQGNYIGTNSTGMVDVGNGLDGIWAPGMSSLDIAGNVVAGNTGSQQIYVPGCTGCLPVQGADVVVSDNIVGLAADGDTALVNGHRGIFLYDTAGAAVDGNTISGHSGEGLLIQYGTSVVVTDNRVGTDITGELPRGNGLSGISIYNLDQSEIGRAGEGNVVSANAWDAIFLSGDTTLTSVRGNMVGTDDDGTTALGNAGIGVHIQSSHANQVGGTGAGEGNVIAASTTSYGAYLYDSDDNDVLGNLIGVAADGTTPLGNANDGVHLSTASDRNDIGGTVAGAGNRIANSVLAGTNGVTVAGGFGNRVRGNSIHSNAALGIDIDGGGGVLANDTGDLDGGANRHQNFPVLSSSASNASGTQVSGTLNSRPSRAYDVDFYSNAVCDVSGNGEGETYLGSITVTTDGSGNASFTANLAPVVASGAAVTATATHVALGDTSEFSTCVSNAGIPTVSVSPAALSVSEGAGTATFTVSLSSPPTLTPATVTYKTDNGSATAADYTPHGPTMLTFNAGETTKTVNVAITNDALDEPDETFTLTLSNPNNTLIATGQSTATITDDDAPPAIDVANAPNRVEAPGTVTQPFTVTLSAPSAQTVTVIAATVPTTATSDIDYQSSAQLLTFVPGDTSETFTVTVLDDALDEASEVYLANLYSPTNATIGDGSATGLIADNDAVPSLSINDVSITEGNSGTAIATFAVTLNVPSGRRVQVSLSTADGTASAPSDYTTRTAAIATIPVGTTSAAFTVTVKGDTLVEPNETFLLNMSSPVFATIADGQGIGTIVNND